MSSPAAKVGDRAARTAVTATFVCNGLLLSTFIARIPALRAALEIREGTLGLLLGGFTAGIIVGLITAGRVVGRTGSRRLTFAGAAIALLALPAVGFAPNILTLAIVLPIFGAGTSSMDVGMNAQAVGVQRGYSRSILVAFHGLWSIGTLSGALIGSQTISLGVASGWHMGAIAILVAVVVMVSSPWLRMQDRTSAGTRSTFAWPSGVLFPLALVALAATLGETAAGDWSGVYLDETVQVPDHQVGWGYVAFTAAMTASRLVGDAVVRRVGAAITVQLGGMLGGLGFLLTALLPTLPTTLIGFTFVGLGLGSTVPLLFGAAGRVSRTPGAGVAAISSFGYIAGLLGPPLIGGLADATNLRFSLAFVGVAVIALTVRRPPALSQGSSA